MEKRIREIEIRLSAKDQASAVFDRVQARMKNLAQGVPASVRGQFGRGGRDDSELTSMARFYGRQEAESQKLRQVQRNSQEQAIRDEQARMIRQAREESRRAVASAEARRRMFGEDGPAARSARSSAAMPRAARSGLPAPASEPSGLRGLASQAQDLNRLMRLGGALVIADRVGAALQKLPEEAEKFRKHMANGGSALEGLASSMVKLLPGVGELAKGIRASLDWIGDELMSNRGEVNRSIAEKQENKRIQEEMRQKRDTARAPVIEAGNRLARETSDRFRMAGLEGPAAQRMQARLEYDQELRAIKELEAKKGMLSVEQQDRLTKQISAARAQAQRELNQKLAAIDSELYQKLGDMNSQAADERKRILFESEQERLRSSGRTLEAEKRRIGRETELAIAEVEKRRSAERETEKGTPFAGGADRRATEAIALIRAREQQQIAGVESQDAKERKEKAAQQAERRLEIDREAQRLQVQMLQESGALSERDRQRLQIAEDMLERRQKLLDIIKDESATEQQKAWARKAIDELPAYAQRQMGAADRQQTESLLRSRAGGVDARFSGGFIERYQDRMVQSAVGDGPAVEQRQIAENTKKTNQLLETLIRRIGAPLSAGSGVF